MLQDNLSQHIKPVGIVRYVKRKADSLEITADITQHNVITEAAIQRMIGGDSIGPHIGISSQTRAANKYNNKIENVYAIGFTEAGVTSPIFTRKAGPTPHYGQWQQRFLQPVSTRTIETIFLSTDTATPTNYCTCYVKLATPCIQNPDEILDIFYRVEFVDYNAVGISDFAIEGIAKSAIFGNNETRPSAVATYWTGNAGNGNYYDSPINDMDKYNGRHSQWDTVGNGYSKNFNSSDLLRRYYKLKFAWNIGRDWQNEAWPVIGRIFGAMNVYTDDNHSVARATVLDGSNSGKNSMLQPTFFHSRNAENPLQDVNYLSAGKGVIDVNGSWVQQPWPKHYRVDILNSGATGVSRYQFRSRNFMGWHDDSYVNRSVSNPFMRLNSIIGGHLSDHAKWEPFSDTKIIAWDNTGITLIDMSNGVHETYDNTTAVQLNVTSINQCTGEGASNSPVWIASRTEGLFKIDRQNNQITHYSFPEVFIDSNKCYGVTTGKNGSIWAIMHGALVYTVNSGATWEVIGFGTSVSINHSDITENDKWYNIKYIKANKDASRTDDQVGIVIYNKIIWWSRGAGNGQTVSGPSISATKSVHNYDISSLNYDTKKLRCSDFGSIWIYSDDAGSYNDTVRVVEFGKSSIKTTYNYGYTGCPGFIYDKQNNPFYAVSGDHRIAFYNIDDEIVDTCAITDGSFNNIGLKGSCILPGNIMIVNDAIMHLGFATSTSGLLSDQVYDHYGWNSISGQWEKGFFGTVPTRQEGYANMYRYGFLPNSWNFDGKRTWIKIAPTGPTDIKEEIGTIAMTVTSSQIADGTDKILFAIGPTNFAVAWHSNIPGKMAYWDNNRWNEITDTPVDANPHRFIFSLRDREYLSVWKDGVKVLAEVKLTNKLSTKNYTKFILGASINENYQNHFEGRIENLAIYNNSFIANQPLVDFDTSNYQANPNFNLSDYGPNIAYNLINTHFNKHADLLFDATTGTFGDNTSTSLVKHLKWTTPGQSKPKITFKVDVTSSGSNCGVGFSEARDILSGAGYARDVFNFAIIADVGTAAFYHNNSNQYNIGAINANTLLGIEIDGSKVNIYKDSIKVFTSGDIVNTTLASSRFAGIKFDYAGRGSGTIMEFTDSDIINNNIVMGHWIMNEPMPVCGSKITHTANEALTEGILVNFQDKAGAVQQWVHGDYYTYSGCNGFLKDNIRTFSGEYSFFWKPTQFGETTFTPNFIQNSSTEASAKSGGVYNEYSIVLGSQGSATGAYKPNFLMIDATTPGVSIKLSLNGTEVTAYKYDNWARTREIPTLTGGTDICILASTYGDVRDIFDPTKPIYAQRQDGTYTEHTWYTANTGNGYVIRLSNALTGTDINPGSIIFQKNANILPGEVAINEVLGIARFNSADVGKSVTGQYTYLYDV